MSRALGHAADTHNSPVSVGIAVNQDDATTGGRDTHITAHKIIGPIQTSTSLPISSSSSYRGNRSCAVYVSGAAEPRQRYAVSPKE